MAGISYQMTDEGAILILSMKLRDLNKYHAKCIERGDCPVCEMKTALVKVIKLANARLKSDSRQVPTPDKTEPAKETTSSYWR